MIKKIGYLLALIFSFPIHALGPVEGIVFNEVEKDFQIDPLRTIFSDIYEKTPFGDRKKVKLYESSVIGGDYLAESCTYLGEPTYSTSWEEKQARRGVVSTLQLIGLDTTIKAIGSYSKLLELNEIEFNNLKKNIVVNYCSKNLTVISLKTIEKLLAYYYDYPDYKIIPSLESSTYAPEVLKKISSDSKARSREFDLVLKNFRSFCSWGGDVEDYRMLSPYLKNPFIMNFVFKNMGGIQEKVDEKLMKVVSVPSENTVRVACTDLICRREPSIAFEKKFPMSLGSTDIQSDLAKLYCHHFRYQDISSRTNPKIKDWLKNSQIEDPVFETSQFISLMTGVPDFFSGVENYNQIIPLIRSSIDDRWTKWAKSVTDIFSRYLLFEESFKIKTIPRGDATILGTKGFGLDFNVTLGEMDLLISSDDNLSLLFYLKIPKNYLRYLRSKYTFLEKEIDIEGQKKFKQDVAKYLGSQLREKEKSFRLKIWNDDLLLLMADELIKQSRIYSGPLYENFQEKILLVPVKFSFGTFAISYLRYRSEVAAGRSGF